MENFMQSPAMRGKNLSSLLGRTSSGILSTPKTVLKTREEVRNSPVIDAVAPSSPKDLAKGTPSRKRRESSVAEDKKVDATRNLFPADAQSELKRLTQEIADQKRQISDLTAQKESLERESAQHVTVRQMLIDNLKSELQEAKTFAEQQNVTQQQIISDLQRDSAQLKTAIEEANRILEAATSQARKEFAEEHAAHERSVAKVLALEAALNRANEKISQLEKENLILKAKITNFEERELNTAKHMEQIARNNAELEAKLSTGEKGHFQAISNMTTHIDNLKRQYFFSTALSIKLGQFYLGKQLNTSLGDLYEKITKADVPFSQWPQWINDQLLAAAEEPARSAKRQKQQQAAPAPVAAPAKKTRK